jgi:hypothetical protein
MLKFIQKWLRNNFLKKYGFGWWYRDFFLHFRILLTDDCVCVYNFIKWKNPNENVKYEHGMWNRMLYRTIDFVLFACKRPRESQGLKSIQSKIHIITLIIKIMCVLAPGLSLSIILTLLSMISWFIWNSNEFLKSTATPLLALEWELNRLIYPHSCCHCFSPGL